MRIRSTDNAPAVLPAAPVTGPAGPRVAADPHRAGDAAELSDAARGLNVGPIVLNVRGSDDRRQIVHRLAAVLRPVHG